MKQVAVYKGPGRDSAESQQSADRTAVDTVEGFLSGIKSAFYVSTDKKIHLKRKSNASGRVYAGEV